jgi:hypothetical protein
MDFKLWARLIMFGILILFTGLAGSARAAGDWQGPPPPGTIDENGYEWGWPVELPPPHDDYETPEETKKNSFRPADAIDVRIDGSILNFYGDVWPYINRDNRVMVPVRKIAEGLGAAVDWDGTTKTVSIYRPYDKFLWGGFEEVERPELSITLKIGEKSAIVNGRTVVFDTRAELKDGRTLVPLRFVAENFGAVVEWLADLKMVEVHYAPTQPHTH